MRKLILPFLLFCLCSPFAQAQVRIQTMSKSKADKQNYPPDWAYVSTIYEVNIRQYTPEGTLEAFRKHLPRLKNMGVEILWIMPVQPIGKEKRKGSKGSYYSISDYMTVNPEFGSMEDFIRMVDDAHALGMKVILDWVANHSAFDHYWTKNQPDFYVRDEKGNIKSPVDDWSDVADLNYDNQELRKAMIRNMKFWIDAADIDGFRCDVAYMVPTDFWQKTIPELRTVKNIFMLAEAWEPELLKDSLFDMAYGWEAHHTMNRIAQGKNTVENWDKLIIDDEKKYASDDILMNFVDNHDENSWNGTIQSRLGAAEEAMTALIYVMPGMPLVYSGNEYGLKHSLKFFEKDSIPKIKGKDWELRAKLGQLKNENSAL